MYVIIAIIAAGFALFYCSYQIRLGAYVRSLCRNRAAGHVVALTFDDGPDPEQTPRVLDTLREHGVRATFFLIGSKAELHPEIVRRMAAEGHAIGIHTWSHSPGFPMRRSGAMAADILRCRESLREITGVETDLFRPPYGVTNPMVARAVKRTRSRCVGWSIRSLDTLRHRSR
ncbi:MAG: polysaccharide deacetylase family protein, partial [Alistipes onderdonkii]|nr:polysaccharide deacetylase family protein [Alistipes onderdonkii]